MVVRRCRSACRCRAVIARGVTSEISAPVSISSVTGLPSIMAGTLMNPRSKATGISAAFWIAQASGGAGGGGAERSLPVGKLPDGGDGTDDSHDVDEDRADDPLRGARSQTGDLTAQIAAELRDVAFEFRAQRRDVALHPGDVAPGRDFSGKCLGEGGGSTVGLIMREAGAFEAAGELQGVEGHCGHATNLTCSGFRLTVICAQDRVAMAAIRSGICIRVFQASRQAWTISG